MKYIAVHFSCLIKDECGATAIEYALIGSLLSIAIIASAVAMNNSMVSVYEEIRSYIVPALEGNPRMDGE
ncbi:pilus assembly protein Flp/PilA [Devosia crocina]|uniref:Pilus assembly protein Flp/PilA n=1 Tax=Devosia crocina TaxID=429728 RepID=A0A1I7NPU3_9HYPH|nr:Flp family type IVb pilin [Devosia crocina]SFV36608.1 pilus assembly protein Flp/PilA [Devosia crocina]